MYEKFMQNPAQNSVRRLAELHGLSIKRVEAILRLKGLEEHWKQVSRWLLRWTRRIAYL